MIGCDPEFGLVTTDGQFIVPDDTTEFHYGLRRTELDPKYMVGFPTYGLQIGRDGNNGELRPAPAQTAVDGQHRTAAALNRGRKKPYPKKKGRR